MFFVHFILFLALVLVCTVAGVDLVGMGNEPKLQLLWM